MTRASVDFQEEKPTPGDDNAIATAIWRMSLYDIGRTYRNQKPKTAAYTMDPIKDRIILADASGGAVTIILPAAAEADETEYTVVATDVSGGAVTVNSLSGNINGNPSVLITLQYHSITVVSDLTNYFRTDIHF